MSKYKRRGTDICDALQWSGSNWHEMLAFAKWEHGIQVSVAGNHLVFTETDQRALPGDWVIVHANGNFAVTGDDYFQSAYEKIPDG